MRIIVNKAFTLTTKDGKRHEFAVGVHDVSKDVAEHWYTKAHAEPAGEANGSKEEDKSKKDK